MTDFALARRNMVDGQLRPNRVTNAALLAVIGELPRERFLPDAAALGRLCRRRRAAGQRPLPDGADGAGPADPDPAAAARETAPWWSASGRGYGAALLARLVQVGRRPSRATPAPGWRPPSRRRRNWRSPASEQTVGQAGAGRAGVGALRRHPDRRRGPAGPPGDRRSAWRKAAGWPPSSPGRPARWASPSSS